MSPAELKAVAPVENRREVQPRTWDELQRRAESFAQSALIPASLKGKPADIAIILQMGWELDIPPMQAINGITVIQGKPTVSPELAIALIRAKVPDAYIKIDIDEVKGVATCTMARARDRMEEAFTSTWDLKRARQMGLDKKDNYIKQPMTMLKWRAVGEAARTVFPDVTKGIYLTEEMEQPAQDNTKAQAVQDLIDEHKAKEQREMREVKAEVMPAPAKEPRLQPISELVAEVKAVAEAAQAADEPDFTSFEQTYVDPVVEILAEYVAPMDAFRGKKLRDIPRKKLRAYVNMVQKKFEESGKKMSSEWMEMLTRMDQYLIECEANEDGDKDI